MRINNNVAALNSWRNLSASNTQMGKSLEKLSSGLRINRAADDASGLVISQSLRAQISGLKQATRNAQDGISLVQTAEGALNEVHTMLNRMRDLAVQSSNTGTMDSTAIQAAQDEFDQLRSEISRIAGSTSFGNQKLLDGTFAGTGSTTGTGGTAAVAATATGTAAPALDFGTTSGTLSVTVGTTTTSVTLDQTYADSTALLSAINNATTGLGASGVTASIVGGNLVLTGPTAGTNFTVGGTGLTALNLASGATTNGAAATTGDDDTAAATGGATFQVGAYAGDTINVTIAKVDAEGLGIEDLDLADDASAAITALDDAIGTISGIRGQLGAVQNRFESTINNLQVTTENLTASESRIRDVDMASEMTNFTKQQVLLQAGTAMLGQANSLSQSVLSLLQ